MPYNIELREFPAGYAVTAAHAGEMVRICFREFTSTEDGQHFIQRLEGLVDSVLQALPATLPPSQIDNMMAIFYPGGSTTVYVNELDVRLHVRTATAVSGGDNVFKDDIAVLERLAFDFEIPKHTGFLYLFSSGWRKGLFYDLGPVLADHEPRQYDPTSILAQAYSRVLFQERFSISDSEWEQLLNAKWFPFVGLSNSTIDKLISYVRSGWDPNEEIANIVAEVRERVPQMLETWRRHTLFASHIAILERGVTHFLNEDYISASGLLYPRIEGILRTHHSKLDTRAPSTQSNLSDSAVISKSGNEWSLLLPYRFRSFLKEVYFASFDETSEIIDVSRNSVGHGVANVFTLDERAAAVAILTIHQLSYFL